MCIWDVQPYLWMCAHAVCFKGRVRKWDMHELEITHTVITFAYILMACAGREGCVYGDVRICIFLGDNKEKNHTDKFTTESVSKSLVYGCVQVCICS